MSKSRTLTTSAATLDRVSLRAGQVRDLAEYTRKLTLAMNYRYQMTADDADDIERALNNVIAKATELRGQVQRLRRANRDD